MEGDIKTWMENDGGRSKYFKGTASDCAARAMAIALNKDYKECYNELAEANKKLTGKKSARNGQRQSLMADEPNILTCPLAE